jgi:glutaredoxin
MTAKRKIEIFSAGCPVCRDAVSLVNRISCESCEVNVLDMNKPEIAERAKTLGIRSVPSIVIDGKLAECCAGKGLDEATLKDAGIGKPLT